ncbi:hypothetical protein V2W45_1328551 [Cenococcum geophilum]
MLSYTTKEIALRAGDILGGFLNITFSICFFFRGINQIKQHFNITVADTMAGLLALYISGLIILTTFYFILLTISPNSFILNRELFRGIAIILLIIYVYYLIF